MTALQGKLLAIFIFIFIKKMFKTNMMISMYVMYVVKCIAHYFFFNLKHVQKVKSLND